MAGTRANHDTQAGAQGAPIAAAVEILKAGGLVAFATETVYGLGADARQSAAVRGIFSAKGRPGTNPLIVHVADELVARRYARHWPQEASKLAAAFWPGPLTIVVAKAPSIVDEVTAGKETVALRVPAHPIALELLRRFGGPIAAPSANRSGRVSPTTAEHVRKELEDRVGLILDGGPCEVGIESTVLNLSGLDGNAEAHKPIILRPGGISRAKIEALIGPVELFSGQTPDNQPASSPGLQSVHYSPATPTYRFEYGNVSRVAAIYNSGAGGKVVVLAITNSAAFSQMQSVNEVIEMPTTATAYATALYSALHCADALGVAAIWVEMPPDEPDWGAVRDRLLRASKAT